MLTTARTAPLPPILSFPTFPIEDRELKSPFSSVRSISPHRLTRLIQALSAVPWEETEGGSSASDQDDGDDTSSDDDESADGKDVGAAGRRRGEAERFRAEHPRSPSGDPSGSSSSSSSSSRPHRPQQQQPSQTRPDSPRTVDVKAGRRAGTYDDRGLYFPFPENTIAREAKAPGPIERSYERAERQQQQQQEQQRRSSSSTDDDDKMDVSRNDDRNESLGSSASSSPHGGNGGVGGLSSTAMNASSHLGQHGTNAPSSGPRIRDAPLLNARSGDRTAGHVSGGLSGRLEGVKHRPAKAGGQFKTRTEDVVDGDGRPKGKVDVKDGNEVDDDDDDEERGTTTTTTAGGTDGETDDSAVGRRLTRRRERAEIQAEEAALEALIAPPPPSAADAAGRPASPANSLAPTFGTDDDREEAAGSGGGGAKARGGRQQPQQQRETDVDRWRRKAKLAEKLKMVFDLDEVEQVVREMGCWLLRSVCASPAAALLLPSSPSLSSRSIPKMNEKALTPFTPPPFFSMPTPRSAPGPHVCDDRPCPLLCPHAREAGGPSSLPGTPFLPSSPLAFSYS